MASGFLSVLGSCCCPVCPFCPGSQTRRGWYASPIPGCPQCVDCIQCPDYPTQVGWTDATGYNANCRKCPSCTDNPCYESSLPGLACQPCIPTKFLVSFAGVDSDCPCFIADSGTVDPRSHLESSGSPVSFCSDSPLSTPWTATYWGDDGPPDCAAPTTVADVGSTIGGSVGVSFGGGVITVTVRAFGNFFSGGFSTIFCGVLKTTDCAGPWIVPNEVTGCSYAPLIGNDPHGCYPTIQEGTYVLTTSSGGVAIVVPCGC